MSIFARIKSRFTARAKALIGGALSWAGVNWIMSSAVGGLGTSTELLYIWHRSAIGYACNVGDAK